MHSRLHEIERRLHAVDRRSAQAEQLAKQLSQMLPRAWNTGAGEGGGGFFVGVATTAITARSGSTLGTGTVEVYSTSDGTMAATGVTQTVYNLDTAISSGKRVAVQPDSFGTLIAAPLECE